MPTILSQENTFSCQHWCQWWQSLVMSKVDEIWGFISSWYEQPYTTFYGVKLRIRATDLMQKQLLSDLVQQFVFVTHGFGLTLLLTITLITTWFFFFFTLFKCTSTVFCVVLNLIRNELMTSLPGFLHHLGGKCDCSTEWRLSERSAWVSAISWASEGYP